MPSGNTLRCALYHQAPGGDASLPASPPVNFSPLPAAQLRRWQNQHPRSSKAHPDWYVDCDIKGARVGEVAEPYSVTYCCAAVLQRDGYTCRACGRRDGPREVQHILPRCQMGADHPRNLVTLCRSCHLKTFRFGYRGIPGVVGSGMRDNRTLEDFK